MGEVENDTASPSRPADMTITLRFWDVPGGVHVGRDIALGSDKYRAVEDELEPHHHEAIRKLMSLYVEPLVGLFVICGSADDVRDAVDIASREGAGHA